MEKTTTLAPMRNIQDLARQFVRLDGRGYPAYKSVAGTYEASNFLLIIDHVQGDPYAEPSRVRVQLAPEQVDLPSWALSNQTRRVAAADFLNRAFYRATRKVSNSRGSGHSGELRVLRPGQEVLERTSVLVGEDGQVEARFRVGLPASGRRILGHQAAQLLTRDVPTAVEQSLVYRSLDSDALRHHAEVVEDARALRDQLERARLVAFVAEASCLPRRSGVDDRPLAAERAMPFRIPSELRVTLQAPNAGTVVGMGVPQGVTLIVGGGYHGKSTLLRAIERGVYDHIPGDGRERVVTVTGAVKVRAEDGRRVAGTDISNFIDRLPDKQDTRTFRTENASGSTSQAAAIVEALELGANCLLLDEDTSATNFMIRDARMQALVADEFEPITPFIDRARQLADELGVSTLLVVGGAGDYFDVADTVIAMRNYVPEAVTAEAKRVAAKIPSGRRQSGGPWKPISPRIPVPESLDPSRGRREVSIKTRTEERVQFGTEEVDLSAVEQIVELSQTRAMAQALVWARGRAIDGCRPLPEALRMVTEAVSRDGLDILQPRPQGDFASFRIFELAAFLNRVRSLEMRQVDQLES